MPGAGDWVAQQIVFVLVIISQFQAVSNCWYVQYVHECDCKSESAAAPLLNWGYGTANSANGNIDRRYRIRDRIEYCKVASLGHGGIFATVENCQDNM